MAGVVALAAADGAAAAVPTANTGPARAVTQSSAQVTGTVNPNGSATFAFQYGTTRSYGATTPSQTAAGNKRWCSGRRRCSGGRCSAARAAGARITPRENAFPFTRVQNVATTNADAAGRFQFSRRPGLNTQYQVVANTRPSATSGVLTVRVRVKLTLHVGATRPRRGQRVLFRGTATPQHNGRFVLIQRLVGRVWRTSSRTRLTQSTTPFMSSFSVRVRITHSGRYRVRVAHDAGNEAGTSSTRRLRLR